MSSALANNRKPQRALLLIQQIDIYEGFRARQGPNEPAHTRTLAQAPKRGQALDPLDIWIDTNEGAEKFVLLDGYYRLSAYQLAKWDKPVPVRLHRCTRAEALLLVIASNSKDRLALSPHEKQDYAWRLVRDPEVSSSRAVLSRATGVSEATISRMRRRWKVVSMRPEYEPSGNWRKDQEDAANGDFTPMTDEERKAAIQLYVGRLRDLLDWRKGSPVLREEEARLEIISEAIGLQMVRTLAEWVLGGEEETDDWLSGDTDSNDEDMDVNF
jgi:hypothetical protein